MVEIRFPPGVDGSFLRNLGCTAIPLYTSVVSLESGEDVIFKNIHPYARNRIRKAQKSGIQIIVDGRNYLSQYCEMEKETLEPHGLRARPKRFYEMVLERLQPTDQAKFFIALYDGKPVSGGIFLFYKDTVYYWHGASFRQYLSIAPTQLLHWELMKYAIQKGYKKYDLLNIEVDRLPGIARFKMRFGGDTKTYYRAFYKTPSYRLPLIRYYLKNPSYVCNRLMDKSRIKRQLRNRASAFPK
ncbi:MAG: peptidoglycan bridge formation glycyltransferase FemA/FemB family protein [Deltaproteobacteria bacterium]|nr:peptidoglycan bridge formation glycyltransferase FemA/FemB family protein [Deltaproteobacteria bacterium]